jgi:hypothetical protein
MRRSLKNHRASTEAGFPARAHRHWRKRAGVAFAILLAACQPGRNGPLNPVATPDVTLFTDQDGHPGAVVNGGPLLARVTGSWDSLGQQDIAVVYSNQGDADIAVTPAQFKMRHRGDPLVVSSIVDMTDVSYSGSEVRDNAVALFNPDTPMVRSLTIPKGATRRIELTFDGDGRGIDARQSFEFDVALPSATASIGFQSGYWDD